MVWLTARWALGARRMIIIDNAGLRTVLTRSDGRVLCAFTRDARTAAFIWTKPASARLAQCTSIIDKARVYAFATFDAKAGICPGLAGNASGAVDIRFCTRLTLYALKSIGSEAPYRASRAMD